MRYSEKHPYLLIMKSLTLKNSAYLLHQDCVGCGQIISNNLITQILIEMLLNPDCCVEVLDVTFFLFGTAHFKPVRRADKSFLLDNLNWSNVGRKWVFGAFKGKKLVYFANRLIMTLLTC